jgi:hypothetical protein
MSQLDLDILTALAFDTGLIITAFDDDSEVVVIVALAQNASGPQILFRTEESQILFGPVLLFLRAICHIHI